ncbi:P-loop containing nucleoside triphosphate hydrolase protein [Penicillium longicatenatum]|nr:P-loop containing nucleoside triphosphate hydrolase protein [Penicillium longicatenatum]
MQERGRTEVIEDCDSSVASQSDHESGSEQTGSVHASRNNQGSDDTFSGPMKALFSEVLSGEEYSRHDRPRSVSRHTYERSVRDLMARFRGREPLSEFGEGIMSVVFGLESTKWRAIAESHLNVIFRLVEKLINHALERCVERSRIESLRRQIIEPKLKFLRKNVYNKLEELLICHRGGNPGFLSTFSYLLPSGEPVNRTDGNDDTDGSSIVRIVRKISRLTIPSGGVVGWIFATLAERFKERAAGQVMEVMGNLPHGAQAWLTGQLQSAWHDDVGPDLQAAMHEFYSSNCEEIAAIRLVDQFEGYYQMNLISFVGYVNAMVVEHTLLNTLPEAILCETIIEEQDRATIDHLVGQSENVKLERSECERQIRALRASIDRLRKFQL